MASKKLVKKLDLVFSEYVRLRDAKNGVFLCCSCGRTLPTEQMDAGHFISRKWYSTRWHEDNVNGQCRSDNRFGNGEAAGYAMFMIKKHGIEYVEQLYNLSRQTAKYKDYELEEKIAYYKQKIKELKGGHP